MTVEELARVLWEELARDDWPELDPRLLRYVAEGPGLAPDELGEEIAAEVDGLRAVLERVRLRLRLPP